LRNQEKSIIKLGFLFCIIIYSKISLSSKQIILGLEQFWAFFWDILLKKSFFNLRQLERRNIFLFAAKKTVWFVLLNQLPVSELLKILMNRSLWNKLIRGEKWMTLSRKAMKMWVFRTTFRISKHFYDTNFSFVWEERHEIIFQIYLSHFQALPI